MTHSETIVAHPPAARTPFALRACRRVLEARLDDLREGVVEVTDGDRTRRFGTPADPALAARIELPRRPPNLLPARGVLYDRALPASRRGEGELVANSSEEERGHGDGIDWLCGLPFLAVHGACVAAIWTGVSPVAIAIGAVTLLTRMFGLTAGYHRYFCHRAFRTTRAFQFVLAWLGASAAQMGPLWWAGHHRSHHRHSDTGEDVHSPSAHGFLAAHFGWILRRANQRTKVEWVPDLARFRELCWLDRNHYLAPLTLGVALYAFGEWLAAALPALGADGAQLVVVALFWSTTALYHVTFAVNSLAHRYGSRRYDTGDHSRNLWWLALITAGEGWHNNHHRYPASERQGFYWWECDLTHYGIVVLSWLGIVWDVRGPAPAVLEEGAGPAGSPGAASRPAWR